MTFQRYLLAALTLAALACRSPLANLPPHPGGTALSLRVDIEDHSRDLKHLRDPQGEANTPESRQTTLEGHRQAFDADFRAEAEVRGLRLDPTADFQLELKITSLGEVRPKYIAWGIVSGVAWGVGVGLLAHDARLAVGLGVYELLEESAFWIGGAVLMGRWSSPAVVEASLRRSGEEKPLWKESYYMLWARKELEAFPPAERERREVQLRASLRKVLAALFKDLEAIPEFPRAVRRPQPKAEPPLPAAAAPAPPPPG